MAPVEIYENQDENHYIGTAQLQYMIFTYLTSTINYCNLGDLWIIC